MSLGEFIGRSSAESTRMNNELSVNSNEDITVISLHQDDVEVWDCRLESKIYVIVGSDLIWDHDLYGEWDAFNWGDDSDWDYTTTNVYNGHNLFPEMFYETRFIDEDISTGSISLHDSQGYYLLEPSEFLQTRYIAKEDKTYTAIKIILDAEYEDDGTDAIDGISAYAIINNVTYTLTNNVNVSILNTSTDGIKIKLINNDSSRNIKIKTFYVSYSARTFYYPANTYAIDGINQIYQEFLYADSYIDIGSTSAILDTTNKEMNF